MIRHLVLSACAAGALTLAVSASAAAQDGPQTPLRPADANGTWSLETKGANVCRLELSGATVTAGIYGVKVPATCGDLIPAGVRGWAPTADGMALVGADGARLIAFNRWSNSLFVSHRTSGEDIQLRRGGPVHPPAS